MSVLVGRSAPDFCEAAVLSTGEIVDNFRLSDALNNKYGLIFFYPLDFTFVCPSELIALNNRMQEFRDRGVEVIAVSIDSAHTHNAWRNTPISAGGIGPVEYTLVADKKHNVCQAYGVEHPEEGIAFRGTFLIDKNGMVRSQIVNDLPIGRNVDEILRLFDAIDFHAQHGEVCPANWNKGKAAMTPNAEGVAKYLNENAASL